IASHNKTNRMGKTHLYLRSPTAMTEGSADAAVDFPRRSQDASSRSRPMTVWPWHKNATLSELFGVFSKDSRQGKSGSADQQRVS
ncbi:MAG: hypothetical protein NTV97_20565, partial [Alphaproteobacteria bacterium]|nr:hypothetical protein [Alphaproteobacteria bacterium]